MRLKRGRLFKQPFYPVHYSGYFILLYGIFTIPIALAALILSLRAQDWARDGRMAEAQRVAWWAGFCGWLTVIIALIPIFLIIFFGGTIIAFLTAMLAAA